MKKQILFFFPENPFSDKAGNVIRAKTNLNVLKKLGYNIDLAGIEDMYKALNDNTDFDNNLVDHLFLLSRRPSKRITSLKYWKYKIIKIFSKRNKSNPLLTEYIKGCFRELLKKKKYDYIIINYEQWTGLLDGKLPNNPVKIIDTHDWITLNEFYKNPLLKIGDRFQEEINNLKKFDRIITISQDEYFIFNSFLGDKVINIPPSFPVCFSSTSKKKYDLIFVGSDNIFNIKSMQWFFNSVYPLLPENINILIIGKICRHLEKKEGVEQIEFSKDLQEYYDVSKISLCPMLEGTGIKIKVIEALSYGLPVVGTERAVDGFSSKYANGCLISNDPEIFKDNIMALLQNESYYQNLKTQAEEYFRNNFYEEKSIQQWKKILI